MEVVPRRRVALDMLKSAWSRKDAPATEVGWRQPVGGVSGLSGYIGAPGTPQRIKSLTSTYGGSETADTWVYACTSLIMGTGASYEWSIVSPDRKRSEVKNPPGDLMDLLMYPNEDMTYFDMAEDAFMDMELAGNSFWLLDQQNGLGQPLAMYRLEPEYVQVVADNRDNKIGYVYTAGNVQIPYELGEIMHFRTRNPIPRIGRFYGMGTVEAVLREIISDLSQSMHLTAFFTNGARISGVITSAEPMTPQQFDQIRLQFQEEYGGSSNAYKLLIADGATKYQPISAPPAALGIPELKKLSKDALLSAFGVPEFLLGGAAQAGIYKMEEAQNVLYRNLLPKAMRFEQTMQRSLTMRWNLGFDIATGVTEPMSIKVARSRDMIGTGASLDEVRTNQGLAPLDTPESRQPLLPSGIIPWPEAINQEPPDSGTFAPDPNGGPSGSSATLLKPVADSAASALDAPAADEKALTVLPLPDGYERMTDLKATRVSPDKAQTMIEVQANFLNTVTPQMRVNFVKFFTEQRNRVIAVMSDFKGYGRRADSRRGKTLRPREELSVGEVWDSVLEDAALVTMYLKAVDTWGPVAVARLVDVHQPGIIWDTGFEWVKKVRDKMAVDVLRVNRTTRSQIEAQIQVGMKRRYSVAQIANGVPDENYEGIIAVFDKAVASRSEVMARYESPTLFNSASLAAFKSGNVREVEVFDGGDLSDEQCKAANNSVWSVDKAMTNVLEHPSCTRFFVPVD